MAMRSCVWMLAAALVWTATSSPAAAGGSKIADSMGDLRWGMSEHEVVAFAQRQIGERYAAQIKKADASKQGKLREQMKREQAEVEKSRVEFEGKKSRWDGSPIAGEFHYGNQESMLTTKDEGAQNYYFFRDGQLWKWFKAVDQKGDFKKFSSAVESKFGKGRSKKGEVVPGQGETQWLEYLDRQSRLRATENKRGGFALIYEDMAAVREMASLRPAKPTRLAGGDDDEEPAAVKSTTKSGDSEVARAQTKRSIFGGDKPEETETDYQSRKQRASEEARERQARAHQKKEDAKQGEVLKTLDGISDSDPLGGL